VRRALRVNALIFTGTGRYARPVPNSSLWEIRDLILYTRDNALPGWGGDDLARWLGHHPQIVAELHEFGRPEACRPVTKDGFWDVYGLYALSRLVEIVLGPHQPANDDPELLAWTTGEPWWSGPPAAASAWSTLTAALHATPIAEDRFHPFFHEIVAVQPADDPDEPASLVAEHWPGVLVGSLLLARSGVTVRAGGNVLDPKVAARSCLYWAWWRRNRPVRDLSHGWGSNSQWGTAFRRDYLVGDQLYYNVDETEPHPRNPADEDPELTAADRRDLLRYRHSLRRDFGCERWPYYESLVERRDAGPVGAAQPEAGPRRCGP
jgi:hypothetical protein